ncbi:hypothetical protein SAMN02745146_1700 [Hymenobacter daecheongensis DSM 21074]|uniref:DUF7033 domain-containing protein n=1 Tax=Hymenobacter daecheongensis DSM 21074 TaxID=1121955 RepID=A0A1M6EIE6_9BACT|nr:hypothetical protein [Hymenobacter daecheongensis]SHI85255.1 hypothetical protein SAMN02745146_1700 [Hymenobacter daecheongensis DSM 21074]
MQPPPLPTVVPTSAEARLTYVLRHFRQAYEAVPHVSIGYADTQPQVEIRMVDHGFFAADAPYPAEPSWREWAGRRLPVFFDDQPERPLLEQMPEGRAQINADLISAAFYLLSGWQEFYSDERDRHGRFPYSASVQHRYGFVAVPVVNYYFDILKTAVEHATGQQLQPRRWAGGAPFATFITHDIDNLRSAWKQPAKAALQRRDFIDFGRQLWRHFTRPDAWDNLALVRETVAAYGAKSTFFFLPEHRKAANGTPNADYRIHRIWPKIAEAIQEAEVGLHAGLGAASHGGKLKEDWLNIPVSCSGIRFHYLSWEPRITPTLLSMNGFTHDSTLGFAEHFGFRNSYCLPFYPFNFAADSFTVNPPTIQLYSLKPDAPVFHTLGPNNSIQTSKFLEIPLNVMDATLHHPNYLRLAPDEILPALTPMFQEIERFGGVCTMLWHNDHFDPANTTTGPRQFAELMRYLCSRKTAFVNGQDICEIMK